MSPRFFPKVSKFFDLLEKQSNMVKDAARVRFCIAERNRRRYFYGIALRGAHQCYPGHDITTAWRRILKEVFRGVSLFYLLGRGGDRKACDISYCVSGLYRDTF